MTKVIIYYHGGLRCAKSFPVKGKRKGRRVEITHEPTAEIKEFILVVEKYCGSYYSDN